MMIDSDRQPTPPGEWETDSNGRRFRYDGRCIEYEPIITTSHGTLTQRQLASMNAKEKDKPAFTYTPPAPSKTCPFKGSGTFVCDKEACAWFTDGGCAQKCHHPAAGKKCPYKHTACAYDCALRAE